MQYAHERFGVLEFTKRTKESNTRIRVQVDRVVPKIVRKESSKVIAHLISMIGGDSEIGALCAAVADGAVFQIELPNHMSASASFGAEAKYFLGSVMVPEWKRRARHLVAISTELAKTKPGADQQGTLPILYDDDEPMFVLYRIPHRYGLSAVPEWAPWLKDELNQPKAIAPKLGIGCSPSLVTENKQAFLKWIGRALEERLIRIPETNGSIS